MLTQTKTSISTLNEYYDLADPYSYEYDIEEIAHALSHICRYTGHVHKFYSVAEHSVLVSRIVPEKYALEGLLHDASEAFCGDVSKPLKAMLPEYQAIENKVQNAIAAYYSLSYPFDESIHVADKQMYWAERKSIAKAKVGDSFWNQENSATRKVEPMGMSSKDAKAFFLSRYKELTVSKSKNEYFQEVC